MLPYCVKLKSWLQSMHILLCLLQVFHWVFVHRMGFHTTFLCFVPKTQDASWDCGAKTRESILDGPKKKPISLWHVEERYTCTIVDTGNVLYTCILTTLQTFLQSLSCLGIRKGTAIYVEHMGKCMTVLFQYCMLDAVDDNIHLFVICTGPTSLTNPPSFL